MAKQKEREQDMTEIEAEIDSLIGQLQSLGPVRIGTGPQHPATPDVSLVPALVRLMEDFPFLTGVRGYPEFIGRYAGASAAAFDQNMVFDIFGITTCSSNLLEYPVAPLDQDGWFSFASGQFWPTGKGRMLDIVTAAFSFDTTGTRTHGVYRKLLMPGPPPPAPIQFQKTSNESFWPDFTSWLSWLVSNRGVRPVLP